MPSKGFRGARVLSAIFEDEPSRGHQHVNATPRDGMAFKRPAGDQVLHWPFPFTPPQFGSDEGPPSYSSDDVEGTKVEDTRKGLRDNRHIAKRGGWKRLVLLAILVILLMTGLVIGLVVGLRDHNKSKTTSSTTTASDTQNATFPAGSYSITTYLTNITTDCTSDPSTWLCYPYTTYSQTPTASSATWDWVITPIPHTANYNVTALSNVFSILFNEAVMTLQNRDADDEHYVFRIPVPKTTKPRAQLTSVNVQATCSFDQASLRARLYTKMGSPLRGSSFGTGSARIEGQSYVPWPYKVSIEQVSPGMVECVDVEGGSLGDYGVGGGNAECGCFYGNDV